MHRLSSGCDLAEVAGAFCRGRVRDVAGGAGRIPERDATPLVRLCVEAHIGQAHRRRRQLAEAGARWAYLEKLVDQRDWPDRLVIALEQSLFQGTDRAVYIAEADVSAPTASSDLRGLLDAGLISQQGRGPTTRYVASEHLACDVRDHLDRATSRPERPLGAVVRWPCRPAVSLLIRPYSAEPHPRSRVRPTSDSLHFPKRPPLTGFGRRGGARPSCAPIRSADRPPKTGPRFLFPSRPPSQLSPQAQRIRGSM